MVVVGGSQRLLSLNPTTVMVVLLLGLWLLLGCDNMITRSFNCVVVRIVVEDEISEILSLDLGLDI